MRQAVCDVCGRDLPPSPLGSTISCPSCGAAVSAPSASLADDETQRLGGAAGADQEDGTTRPIDPSALPPPPTSTASFPEVAAQADETSTPSDPAPPRWYGDPTTQGLPEDFAPPPPSTASTPSVTVQAQVPRKGNRTLVALSVVVLALILAIVSLVGVLASANALPFLGASSPTATTGVVPTPTIATPPGFTVYRDLQGVYQICRPDTWAAREQSQFGGAGVALVKPNSFVSMVIIQQPNPGAATNQALLDSELALLAQQGAVSNQQHLADGSVGGVSWAQGSADWIPAQPGATTEHIVLLATLHDGRSFVIELVESPGGAASADATTFETMLSCFTFL